MKQIAPGIAKRLFVEKLEMNFEEDLLEYVPKAGEDLNPLWKLVADEYASEVYNKPLTELMEIATSGTCMFEEKVVDLDGAYVLALE